jgi:hypothetical protein
MFKEFLSIPTAHRAHWSTKDQWEEDAPREIQKTKEYITYRINQAVKHGEVMVVFNRSRNPIVRNTLEDLLKALGYTLTPLDEVLQISWDEVRKDAN